MSIYYGDEPKSAKEGDIWYSHPRPVEVIVVPISRRIYNALIKGENE
jgi:hypothetical protein